MNDSYRNESMPKRDVQKVVSGSASKRRMGIAQKLLNRLIVRDVDDLEDYIVDTVLDIVNDSLHGIIDTVFDGHGTYRSGRRYTVYGSRSSSSNRSSSSQVKNVAKADNRTCRFEYPGDLTKDEVLDVFAELHIDFDRYHKISMFELYRLCGMTAEHTMDNWGWESLEGFSWRPEGRDEDGVMKYMIICPKPDVI